MRHIPRRALALSALVITLAACSTATSSMPESTATVPIADPRAPASEATLAQYRSWIAEARAKHPYPESEARMYAVMMCESTGRVAVVNPAGPYTGLFQYVANTWNDAWNIYRSAGMLDAKAQIFATALAWSRNMQNHWGCYMKTASTP